MVCKKNDIYMYIYMYISFICLFFRKGLQVIVVVAFILLEFAPLHVILMLQNIQRSRLVQNTTLANFLPRAPSRLAI